MHNHRRLAAKPIPDTNLNHQAYAEEPNAGRDKVDQYDDTELAVDPNHSGDESFGFSLLFGENASVNEEEENDSVNEGGENTSVNEEPNDENALPERSANDSVDNDDNGNPNDESSIVQMKIVPSGNAVKIPSAEQEFWIDIDPFIKQEADPLQDDDVLVDLLAKNEINNSCC